MIPFNCNGLNIILLLDTNTRVCAMSRDTSDLLHLQPPDLSQFKTSKYCSLVVVSCDLTKCVVVWTAEKVTSPVNKEVSLVAELSNVNPIALDKVLKPSKAKCSTQGFGKVEFNVSELVSHKVLQNTPYIDQQSVKIIRRKRPSSRCTKRDNVSRSPRRQHSSRFTQLEPLRQGRKLD